MEFDCLSSSVTPHYLNIEEPDTITSLRSSRPCQTAIHVWWQIITIVIFKCKIASHLKNDNRNSTRGEARQRWRQQNVQARPRQPYFGLEAKQLCRDMHDYLIREVCRQSQLPDRPIDQTRHTLRKPTKSKKVGISLTNTSRLIGQFYTGARTLSVCQPIIKRGSPTISQTAMLLPSGNQSAVESHKEALSAPLIQHIRTETSFGHSILPCAIGR